MGIKLQDPGLKGPEMLLCKFPSQCCLRLKGIMLRYPTARRDLPLRNTMNTSKLKNMKFKAFHFWGEKSPTNNFEDRIPTMLGPATSWLIL